MPEFSVHALKRMEERGVSEQDVATAIARFSGYPEPGNRGDTVVIRGYDNTGRMLKIVLDAADRDFVVSVWVIE